MANSLKMKVSVKSSENKGSKVSAASSSGSKASPLLKLTNKNYSKKKKQAPGAEQFGTPGFGLTGMTGED